MTKPFKKIAVIGTGTLGAQIAMLASDAGYRVTVFDQQAGAFDAMLEKLDTDMTAKQIEPFIPFDRWPACRQPSPKTLSSNVKSSGNWDSWRPLKLFWPPIVPRFPYPSWRKAAQGLSAA